MSLKWTFAIIYYFFILTEVNLLEEIFGTPPSNDRGYPTPVQDSIRNLGQNSTGHQGYGSTRDKGKRSTGYPGQNYIGDIVEGSNEYSGQGYTVEPGQCYIGDPGEYYTGGQKQVYKEHPRQGYIEDPGQNYNEDPGQYYTGYPGQSYAINSVYEADHQQNEASSSNIREFNQEEEDFVNQILDLDMDPDEQEEDPELHVKVPYGDLSKHELVYSTRKRKCADCFKRQKAAFERGAGYDVDKVYSYCNTCKSYYCPDCFKKIHEKKVLPTFLTSEEDFVPQLKIPYEDLSKHELIYSTRRRECANCFIKQRNIFERGSGYYDIGKVYSFCNKCKSYLCEDCFNIIHTQQVLPKNKMELDCCPHCREYVGDNLEMWLLHTKTCKEVKRPKGVDGKVYKYACVFCVKYSNDKNAIRKHLPAHTKHQPFSCTICNKKYTQKSSLNRHMKNHQASDKPLTIAEH